MEKRPLTRLIPVITAIIVFLAVTLIYFAPLLEGKKIQQGDIRNWTGMSKEIVDFRAKTGEEPLWTNSMFGGMPAYQISTQYPDNLMKNVDSVLRLGLPGPAGLLFISFLGFFILLLVLKADPWTALVGALAYGFSSYFFIILEAGHNSKAHAMAYMAPVLAGVILTYRGKYLSGGVLTALAASLQLTANHLQITYYLLLVLLIVAAGLKFVAFKEKQLPTFFKATGVLAAAALLAVLPSITNLWVTWEYGKESTRGKSELTINEKNQTAGLDKDYVTQWSYGVGETWSLLIPNIKGGASDALGNHEEALGKADPQMRQYVAQSNAYWGDQPFTSGPVYVGAIVIFLFVLGLIIVNGALKWALLIVTMLSIMLAWGHNFMPLSDFFLDYVPGYNKFRAVSMTLVMAELCIPILAFLALSQIANGKTIFKDLRKPLFIALGITAGIALLFALIPTAFFDFLSAQEIIQYAEMKTKGGDAATQVSVFTNSLEAVRISIFKADAIRSFLFILLAGSVIFAWSYMKLHRAFLFIALALLVITDMYTINRRYLNEKDFVKASLVDKPFVPTNADKLIMRDVDPNFRVLNLAANTFNDASTSYFHKSIGGYHGAKLERYQELIDHQISKNNMSVLNMLNTKYFIIPNDKRQPEVQINMAALGNAWFVDSCKMVDNANQEMEALSNFNPKTTAIVDKRFTDLLKGFAPAADSLSVISLQSYAPNHLVYRSNAVTDRLTVFSEIYYSHGWNAYIDGNLYPISGLIMCCAP
ncbi:MAG: hypothetical protein CVU06_00885 [Bacteroidetes bacterium HGW-Bacteroidetes-22]|nr:MAG: hypothetical protein CVU06_00885 [Bacteroidetes bacterium HGW-Bacteroidetes-22]